MSVEKTACDRIAPPVTRLPARAGALRRPAP
jgi:hypothetical protein